MSHLVDDCLLRNGALSCFAAHLHGVKQMVMICGHMHHKHWGLYDICVWKWRQRCCAKSWVSWTKNFSQWQISKKTRACSTSRVSVMVYWSCAWITASSREQAWANPAWPLQFQISILKPHTREHFSNWSALVSTTVAHNQRSACFGLWVGAVSLFWVLR